MEKWPRRPVGSRTTTPREELPVVTAQDLGNVRVLVRAVSAGRRAFIEQGDAGGEPVNEVLPADRAELALGEEPRQRDRAGLGPHGSGVVVGLGEQPRT